MLPMDTQGTMAIILACHLTLLLQPLYDLSTLEPEILGEMNDTVTCVILCEGCDENTKAELADAMMV